MKKLILFLIALIAHPLMAATPIACTALGYNFVYVGWVGTVSPPVNTFAMAGSPDGVNWTSIPATWPTCGNGSPCAVNSPSAVCYAGHVYILLAEASDVNLNSPKIDVGILNDDYTVTTLQIFDLSGLGSVSTVFAGRWESVSGSTNCATVPVTFTSGYYLWSTYQICFTLTTSSAAISTGPTLLTTTGMTNGYDPVVLQAGSTCYLIQTQTDISLSFRASALSSGSCPSGPFTFISNARTFGTPLYPQTAVSPQSEGPNFIQTTSPSRWEFWFENLPTAQMYYSNCTSIELSSCAISTPQRWVEDHLYRAGTILRLTTLPSTTIYGGTIKGGTWQ